MPHTRSAKKRLRQGEKRRLHNRAVIKSIKLQIKNVQAASTAGDVEKLRTEFRLIVKQLDKAAQRRIVHPNLAARKKSQLARLLLAKEKGPAAKA